MGRRDDKLTADSEAAADKAMRALLARRDEPTALPPPADLVQRSLARLPSSPPAALRHSERRSTLRRRATVWASALALLLLSGLGVWGVLLNSNGPMLLFGGPKTLLGGTALVVTLAAKPLIALVLSLGAPSMLAGALVVMGAGWLWWQLAARPTAAPFAMELP